nr:MAG TPA: Protein of unknown function (DUF3392) [Caudoviricetes sp.]
MQRFIKKATQEKHFILSKSALPLFFLPICGFGYTQFLS